MAGTVFYNPTIIEEFAQRLYKQAASIIFNSTLFGLLTGAILLFLGATVAGMTQVPVFALIGAIIGGFWGYIRGRERAFKLKLEAQVALCQVQIERNSVTTNRVLVSWAKARLSP